MKFLRVGLIVLVTMTIGGLAAFAIDLDDATFVPVTEEIVLAFNELGVTKECIAKTSADFTDAERFMWYEFMDDDDDRALMNGLIYETLFAVLNEDIEEAYMVLGGRIWYVKEPSSSSDDYPASEYLD